MDGAGHGQQHGAACLRAGTLTAGRGLALRPQFGRFGRRGDSAAGPGAHTGADAPLQQFVVDAVAPHPRARRAPTPAIALLVAGAAQRLGILKDQTRLQARNYGSPAHVDAAPPLRRAPLAQRGRSASDRGAAPGVEIDRRLNAHQRRSHARSHDRVRLQPEATSSVDDRLRFRAVQAAKVPAEAPDRSVRRSPGSPRCEQEHRACRLTFGTRPISASAGSGGRSW